MIKPTDIFNTNVYTQELNIDVIEKEGFNTFSECISIQKEYHRGEICSIPVSRVGDIITCVSFGVKNEKHVGSPKLLINQDQIVPLGEKRFFTEKDNSDVVYTHVFHLPITPFMYFDMNVFISIESDTYIEFAEITYMAVDSPLRKLFTENTFIYKTSNDAFLIKWGNIEKIKNMSKFQYENVTINGYILQTLYEEVSDQMLSDYCITM